MKTNILALSLLALACSSESTPESQVHIAGGNAVSADTSAINIAQQTVGLANNSDFTSPILNQRSSFCTAIVLTKRLLLTAAHCAGKPESTLYFAVFGTDMKKAKLGYPQSVRQVAKALKHPGYPDVSANDPINPGRITNDYETNPEKWFADNPNTAPHDLAILKLDADIPESYVPATLAAATDNATQVTAAGYGITRTSNIGDTGVLRFVRDIKLFAMDSINAARKQVNAGETISVTDLAAGKLAKVACPGDSGGPLFIGSGATQKVVGVLSLGESEKLNASGNFAFCGGHKAAGKSIPSNIYTDVRQYSEWIAKTISENN